MENKVHVKKGDTVVIISGKDKSKKGKVLKVEPSKGRIVVEGVNMVSKHAKPTQKNPQGGIINREAPVFASKAMLYCVKCAKPSSTGKKILQDGSKVRTCKRCGETLDK